MKRSWALEMMSNIQRKKFALNVRRDGPQPSIFVRSFRSFTIRRVDLDVIEKLAKAPGVPALSLLKETPDE